MAIVRMGSRFRLVALVVVVVVAAGFAAAEPATSIATVFCAERHLDAPVRASVIRADATATEYLLRCGARGHCGDANNDTLILTHGPSTMALLGRDNTFTRGFDCKLQGSSSAKCDFFLDGKYALQSGHFLSDVEPDEYAELMLPLTITAGLEKLAASASTAAPRPMATEIDAPETTAAPTDALVLDVTKTQTHTQTQTQTKTTERRTTAPTGSASPAEVKPTTLSAALTTLDKPGSATTNMRASVALLGKMLGLVTALAAL